MTHFALTASKSTSTPAADMLKFHATMPVDKFVANGYTNANGIDVIINPKGNKHPKGWFIAWKDKEGVAFSGSVSSKLTEPEDLANAVISIVSTPDKPDKPFALLHAEADRPDNTVLAGLGKA